jgi:hypothetical protein
LRSWRKGPEACDPDSQAALKLHLSASGDGCVVVPLRDKGWHYHTSKDAVETTLAQNAGTSTGMTASRLEVPQRLQLPLIGARPRPGWGFDGSPGMPAARQVRIAGNHLQCPGADLWRVSLWASTLVSEGAPQGTLGSQREWLDLKTFNSVRGAGGHSLLPAFSLCASLGKGILLGDWRCAIRHRSSARDIGPLLLLFLLFLLFLFPARASDRGLTPISNCGRCHVVFNRINLRGHTPFSRAGCWLGAVAEATEPPTATDTSPGPRTRGRMQVTRSTRPTWTEPSTACRTSSYTPRMSFCPRARLAFAMAFF